MEITARILTRKDAGGGRFLLDVILDEAQGKGTGKWTAQDAMELGVPVPTINEAVAFRDLSSLRRERQEAQTALGGASPMIREDRQECIDRLGRALKVSTIIIYGQAFAQLKAASVDYGYDLNLAEVARIWRGGCIIRSTCFYPFARPSSRNPISGTCCWTLLFPKQ